MFSPSLETTHTTSKIRAHPTSIEMGISEKICFFSVRVKHFVNRFPNIFRGRGGKGRERKGMEWGRGGKGGEGKGTRFKKYE